jgi:hypothetical protein
MSALIGIAPNAALESDMKQLFRWFVHWHNDASVAGTTAIAEQVGHTCKQKGRVIAARIVANAAVTANATNFFTLLVDKRTAAVPGTPVNLITFAADTPTTDDLAAWTNKDLMAYKTATDTDLDVAVGDVLTFEVTKTGGSGLAFPNAFVEVIFESRD